MRKKNIMKVNKTAIIAIFLFAIITLLRVFNHIPWYDEAHAWTIAEQLNPVDMFWYVKSEGHLFLWALLLMPFAKTNFLYPNSMLLLNWIFCLGAVCLLWWKAPFNNWIKFLITFSFPFLACYSVVARCYAIGILLLFALTALYKDKLNHPVLYSILLVLCANTSVIALFGATIFGILFLYDWYQEKPKVEEKSLILSGLILLFGVIIVGLQVFTIDYSIIVERAPDAPALLLRNIFIYHNFIVNTALLVIFAIPLFWYIASSKKVLFFLITTYTMLFYLVFARYGVNFWHSYFFYIYLIIALWLVEVLKPVKSKLRTLALVIFAIISILLFRPVMETKNYQYVFNNTVSKQLIHLINSDEKLKSSQILHNNPEIYTLLPYAKKDNLKFKNYCSFANDDYNLLYVVKNNACVRGNAVGQAMKYPEIFKNYLNQPTYAFINKTKNPKMSSTLVLGSDFVIYFSKYKCSDEYCFWRVDLLQK